MTFEQVKAFFKSWGLQCDPEGDYTIPYPEVYSRMSEDAEKVGGELLRSFVCRQTDTTDGQTYLVEDSWDQLEDQWNSHQDPSVRAANCLSTKALLEAAKNPLETCDED